MKTIAHINFILILIISFSFLTLAQELKEEPLLPNQATIFQMQGGSEKTFYIELKKDDFFEISWLANDGLDLTFSLFSPSGENILENVYVTDSIPAVASEGGKYRIVVKLGSLSKYEETKILTEQKITLQYSSVLKLPKPNIVTSLRTINGYNVKIIQTKGDESYSFLLIEKLGKLKTILKGDGSIGFYFADDITHAYSPVEKRSAALFRSTLDKTGDGTPDVAVEYFSGGAHCCFDMHFFELGDSIKKLPSLSTGDAETIAIAKNPKGGLRLETGDTTFAYWNVPFAYSPMPGVILDFQNGEFRPNFAAMKKPSPSLLDLQKKARSAQYKLSSSPYTGSTFAGMKSLGDFIFEEAFWGEMLDLIYTGHEDLAWQYLDLVWRVDKPGKALFRDDFKSHLMESPFWRMIQEDAKK